MNLHIAIVICIVGVLFSVITLELVRRKYLRPEYALLWAALSVLTLVLALAPRVVEILMVITGMTYQSSIIIVIFAFTAVMLMNYSVIASRQSSRIVRLTQEIALLQLQIEKLREAQEKRPQ
jgi:hypothetical protein